MQSGFILALLIVVLIVLFVGCLDVQLHTRAAGVGNEIHHNEVVQNSVPVGAAAGGNTGRGGKRLAGVGVVDDPRAG